MSCGEFVGNLFLARDVAHVVHLNTRSYAKHMALKDFYIGIVELADDFAEAYQGKYGLIGKIPLKSPQKEMNILDFMNEQSLALEETRYKVCKKEDTVLQNIIDEIWKLFLSTIYKLRFLS